MNQELSPRSRAWYKRRSESRPKGVPRRQPARSKTFPVAWSRLLPALPEVRIEAFAEALARVNPAPRILPISARTMEGMAEWLSWLAALRAASRSVEPSHFVSRPAAILRGEAR